jgi:hypothetical protein
MLKPVNMEEADEYGFISIPDKWSWWMILYQNTIYILNERRIVD